MKRTQIKTALCATAAAFAALATSAQEAAPATPVQGSATVSTTTTTSPIMVRLGSEAARVVDITGQSVGRVENLVLSPVGCTEAAIVATPNGRLMPVPWTAVRVDTLGVGTGATTVAGAVPTLTVNIDQARLAQAPTFTRTQLPSVISTATWLQPSVAFFSASAPAATGAAGTSSTISGGAATSATATDAAGVTVTGGTNAAAAGTIGGTATGAGSQDRFGTTATGGTNQTRFGGTATRVPTNSSSVLPPTGRPTQPPTTTPATPATPPVTPATPGTPNSGLTPPASPTIPPSGTPAAPPPAAPRSSP